jgi:hypothetical protein
MLERGALALAGYDKLAAIMGAQKELAIYRQYSALNAKNILYLQSELFHLEAELAEIESEDRSSSDPEKALFPRSVWHLKRSLRNPGQDRQWRTALKIREILKEYSVSLLIKCLAFLKTHSTLTSKLDTAILQQAEINKLERPGKSSLKLLKDWLEHPEGGNFFPYGRERRIWEVEDRDDLVALSTLSSRHGEADWFTSWLNTSLFPWCHRHGAHRFKVSFRDSRSTPCHTNWKSL